MAAQVCEAARTLDRAHMVRFDERSGQLYQTEAGRVASHFYIRCGTERDTSISLTDPTLMSGIYK